MSKYFYKAKSFNGEDITGTTEAKDKHELARNLHQQGYVLISANLESQIKTNFGFVKLEQIFISKIRRISLTEKLMFVRNLRVMISAGISLSATLKALASQSKNKKFKNVLFGIEKEIIKGKSLSQSLSAYPKVFSELFINMVRIGEEAGTLEQVLGKLAKQMEREYELKAKIKGAMIYPAVIVCAMLGIGMLMLIMVVPVLAETFAELEIELPFTTKLVFSLGAFLIEKWFLIILIFIVFIFLLRSILKTKKGKKFIDGMVFKIPIISSIIKKTNSAYIIRTLSSLIASGVPIVRSLEIISNSLGNSYFKETIIKAAEKVQKGDKLSQSLKPYENLYPPIVIQMIEVGEESGQTSDILAQLSDFFEEEVSNATKNLSTVIEPVLMIIIGAAVGFFAISMIQPIYGMLGAI